jgi:hypothetical protein
VLGKLKLGGALGSVALSAALLLSIGAVTSGGALAQDDVPAVFPGERAYSPYPDQSFPNRVFFGDTHVHTSYSADAGMIGNTLGPDQAYRFAKGEEVTSSTGLKARLARPLDFLVIADHAENLGLAPLLAANDPALLATDFGTQLRAALDAGDPAGAWSIWSKGIVRLNWLEPPGEDP